MPITHKGIIIGTLVENLGSHVLICLPNGLYYHMRNPIGFPGWGMGGGEAEDYGSVYERQVRLAVI